MEYTIHGPFEIKRQGKTVNHLATELKKFWSEIDEQFEGLSFACGCYLFALKAGKGSTPWYVGKAEKQSFSKEVFNSHKVQYYNDIIANQKGKPIIFILAKRTRKKKFVKPSKNGHSDIDFLETLLIGAALGKNRDLLNKKKSNALRKMIVPGFINSKPGANPKTVAEFISVILKSKE